jgi:hypothetical protein
MKDSSKCQHRSERGQIIVVLALIITGVDRRDGNERGRRTSLLQLAMSAERGRRGRSGGRGLSSLESVTSDLHGQHLRFQKRHPPGRDNRNRTW